MVCISKIPDVSVANRHPADPTNPANPQSEAYPSTWQGSTEAHVVNTIAMIRYFEYSEFWVEITL